MRKFIFPNKMGSLRAVSVAGSIFAPIVNYKLVPYPYMMMLVVTRNCNSRCKMCNIWREESPLSLSTDHIRWIFEQNDFSFVRVLVLTGGEPTLRSDLPEILEIAGKNCPNLNLVQLATNGLNPSRIVAQVKQMLVLIEDFDQIHHLDVQVSMDGIGEIHDWVRGVPGAFQRVVELLDQLAALRRDFQKLRIRLSAVVLPYNLPHLEALQAFASEHGFSITFTPVILSNEYYGNLQNRDLLSFSSVDQRIQAAEFFHKLARREQSSLRHHYMDVYHMLLGNPRQRKCMMGFYGFVVEYNGDVYSCVNCEKYSFGNLLNARFEELWFRPHASYVRQQVHRNCCPTCTSLCYPLPTNLAEVVDMALQRLITSLQGR